MDSGLLLRMVLYDCSVDLRSSWWCKHFLYALCGHLGVTIVSGPHLYRHRHPDYPKADGISAVVIIEESVVYLATWPETLSARLIIDSCRPFNPDIVASWIVRTFGAHAHRAKAVWG